MSIHAWGPTSLAKRAGMGLVLVGVVLAGARLSAGEAINIQVLPGDTPLVVQGRVGNDLVKRIGFIAPAAAVPELIFRSTDLQRAGGTERISRQQIASTSTTKFDLPKNTPKDFELKVTAIKIPGTYDGTLYFLLPEQGMTGALEVPIKVIAEDVPKLTQRKGSESIKIQRVDCIGVGCWLARWFQPGAFASSYPLQFDNSSLEPFTPTASVTAIGDVTRRSLDEALKIQPAGRSVPTDLVYTLPISIESVRLPADHYVGDVQLRLSPQDPTIKIPLEVNVRTGLGPAIIVLILGILLGRLLKYMKDKGGPQSDLLLALHRLEAQVAASPSDQKILQPLLDHVKAQIYAMKLVQAKTDLDAVDKRWTLLTTLRDLERILHPHLDVEGAPAILAKIEEARALIAIEDQEASVTKIRTAIRDLLTRAATAQADLAQARRARAAAARAAEVSTAGPEGKWARAARLVTGVSDDTRAELTLRVIRPLLYVILILGLLAIGLQQLYWKNATFGSDPFNDYFGLLVWAMSADVATRTLSTLKGQ